MARIRQHMTKQPGVGRLSATELKLVTGPASRKWYLFNMDTRGLGGDSVLGDSKL